MKKVLLVLCLSLLLTGCNSSQPSTTADPTISVETMTQTANATDGTPLVEWSYPSFSLQLSDPQATQAMEQDLQGRIDGWMASSTDLESYAQAEYTGQEWTLWFARLTCKVARADSQVISLYLEYSEFTGDSHPSILTDSRTYSSATGQPLQLTDLLAESYALTGLASPVNALLAERAQELYDDYEALVGKAFSDGTVQWYLSDQGLCFHFSPYVIAPYASGPICVTVPYDQLSQVLHPDYLPA